MRDVQRDPVRWGVSISVASLLRDVQSLNHGLPTIASEMCSSAADLGIRLARERSSGPFSSARLASMDYPFAKRHGAPLLDPSIVNSQSGHFRAKWHAVRLGMGAQIVNDAQYADWLKHGTEYAFARPIDEAIESDLSAKAKGELTPKFDRLVSLFLH